jgi:hypothetical protein
LVANDCDLALMRRIDELFTTWPFLGAANDDDAAGRRSRRQSQSAFGG